MNKTINLCNTTMIMGLSGWGNAGEVSTFTVKYLVDKLNAKKFTEIPHEQFHDYWIQRPVVLTQQGLIKSYVSPRSDLFYWKDKKGGRDLVLLIGIEPHLYWPKYAESILELAKNTHVNRIYTIGGYLADIPLDIGTPISTSTNNEEILVKLEKAGLELTDYEGPTSVYSEILWKGREKKIDVVSLWCAVPIYVKGLYPKAAYIMLNKIVQLIDLKLDLKDLKNKAESFKVELEKEVMDQTQLQDLTEGLGKRESKPSYLG